MSKHPALFEFVIPDEASTLDLVAIVKLGVLVLSPISIQCADCSMEIGITKKYVKNPISYHGKLVFSLVPSLRY